MTLKFSNSVKSLLETTSFLQVRILELAEFEKQWKALFSGLTKEFSPDVKINISNQLLLHTFRYDKFHIVCDDLLSLLENEAQNEFSVSRKASSTLRIKTLQEYMDEEKTMPYVSFDIDAKTRKVTTPTDMDFPRKVIAAERRNIHIAHYQNLFGTGSSNEEHWLYLRNNLAGLIAEVKGLRHLFSHRHTWHIQKKYAAHWDDLEIEKIKEWFNNFFKIVQEIAFIYEATHYTGTIASFELEVSDQIDLIIFGSISRCSEIFSENFPRDSYSEARQKFYNSRHFVDICISQKANT